MIELLLLHLCIFFYVEELIKCIGVALIYFIFVLICFRFIFGCFAFHYL